MLNFPILEQLDIWDYGLFPGAPGEEPGLHVSFPAGLTLVLGANGLGKTTLVTILFRMLTGPADIPGLSAGGDLGNLRLEPTTLRPKVRSMFAHRVVDGARDSRARLALSMGGRSVLIERRLRDLALLNFQIDNKPLPTEEGESFQAQIHQLAGLSTFADWILLLRHLTFYFEDRRALVWDASAQRQILRFLFLTPEVAKKWTDDERRVLTLDSHMRNLSAVLSREERLLAEGEEKAEGAPGVARELRLLEELQEVALAQRARIESEIIDLDAERQQARLSFLASEQEHEIRYREFERAKLITIESRFPSLSERSRFILAQLLTEGECLACGSVVPDISAEYNARLERNICIICESDLSEVIGATSEPKLAEKRLQRASRTLQEIRKQLDEAKLTLDQAEERYRSADLEMGRISLEIAERSQRIDSLIRKLPPEESTLHEKYSDILSMRGRVTSLRQELRARRGEFQEFVSDVSQEIIRRSEAVKHVFDEIAKGFLLERCSLTLSMHKQRVGETGTQIDFPAFELDMTGSDFASPVRRTGPEQVSESQREFIDIAFRMALMQVSSSSESGSFIIDAPESSLDAVFVSRAATVLSEFASRDAGNRLLITSNLVEGRLIPELIRNTRKQGGGYELVDLFSIAVPTAAVRELNEEYTQVRANLLAEAQRID